MNGKKLSDKAYITELEKEILILVNEGLSFDSIARRYEIEEKEVRKLFFYTQERIDHISLNKNNDMSIHNFDCKDLSDFLSRMKISQAPIGFVETKLALEYAIQFPKMLDSMVEVFYPRLAKDLDISTAIVMRRIREAYQFSFNQSYSESQIFFNKYGVLRIRGASMCNILKNSIKCIKK